MDYHLFDHQLNEIDVQQDWWRSRSFLYGDAHFTTAKIIDGKIELLQSHLERLQTANQRLFFNDVEWQSLTSKMKQLADGCVFGVIKVQISRGDAVRGYGNLKNCQPQILISVTEMAVPQLNTISLSVLEHRLAKSASLAGIKHCNRLEQVLVAHEAEQKGLIDGLVCDTDNMLIETSKANVFWYTQGVWYTPDLSQSGINGIIRQDVLQRVKVIKVVNKPINEIIASVEAMVITNSLIGLQIVDIIEEKKLSHQHAQDFIDSYIKAKDV